MPLPSSSVLLSFLSPLYSCSCSNIKLIFSFIISTALPPPFYPTSSPLAVASNFAVLFEQILILPAQQFFPLILAQLCLLHFVILCSSSVCEVLSFAAKDAATSWPLLSSWPFIFYMKFFLLDFISLCRFLNTLYSRCYYSFISKGCLAKRCC